jgi:8-oxo-dGTP diphosphatase
MSAQFPFMFILCALLSACAVGDAPLCRFEGEVDSAPSAGCFSLVDGDLLLVQGLNGKISVPGGSAVQGESAQCAAHRETWEETGLDLAVGELLEVYDTGFHLYVCAQHASSGEIDPPPRMEVRQAFYLAPEQFGQWEWRYPEQRGLLEGLTRELSVDANPMRE